MADRYLFVFSVRDKKNVEVVKNDLRDRLKRLPYRFCPTQYWHSVNGAPLFDVRVHVTCSWRTGIEINQYMKDTAIGHDFLIYQNWHVKLRWTGSRWS